MQAYKPHEQKTDFDADQLFGATERAIETLKYRPTKRSPDDHTIETQPKEVGYSSVPRLFYRYAFKVDTSGGTLRIAATCEQNTAMSRSEFEDCGDKRPEKVIEEQDQFRQEILRIAGTLP